MCGLRRRRAFQLFDFPDEANQGSVLVLVAASSSMRPTRASRRRTKVRMMKDVHLPGAITVDY
jgi:hypothetical protein